MAQVVAKKRFRFFAIKVGDTNNIEIRRSIMPLKRVTSKLMIPRASGSPDYDPYTGEANRGALLTQTVYTGGRVIAYTGALRFRHTLPNVVFIKGYAELTRDQKNAILPHCLRITVE